MVSHDFYAAPTMQVVPAMAVDFAGCLIDTQLASFLAVGVEATPEGPALFVGLRGRDGMFRANATTIEHARSLHAKLGAAIAEVERGAFTWRAPS